MENIVQAISAVGFPIIACLLIAYSFHKMILSRLSIQDEKLEKLEIEKQEDRKLFNQKIEKLQKENREDKKMFNKAIEVFNVSVSEFKENNREVTRIKEDVEIIKNKLK